MTMVEPRRFQLSPAQLAAALAIGGIEPTSRANLPALPSPAKTDRGLKSTGLLATGGGLAPNVESALRSVADPSHVVVVLANRAGRREWAQTTIVRGGADQPFVVQAFSDKALDFAVLGSVTQATVVVDALLDLTAFGSSGTSGSLDLDLPGFGALLACADVVQERRLQAWLERNVDLGPVVLTSQLLEDQLGRGLLGQDTRWAVTAALAADPAGLGRAAGGMDDGLTALRDATLVEPGPGGYVLTDTGRDLAFGFGKLVTTGSLSVGVAGTGRVDAIAYLSVFRTPAAIWLASWSGLAGPAPRVRLWSPSAEAAIRVVRGLLDPPAAPAPPAPTVATPASIGATSAAQRRARRTTTTSRPTQGVRAGAGTRPARQPTPTPVPAPAVVEDSPADSRSGAAPPWTPTHRVPTAGMSAWSAPDPSTDAIARLDPGLEVQLAEARGDWAHIVCSNSWEAWVDARRLEELS